MIRIRHYVGSDPDRWEVETTRADGVVEVWETTGPYGFDAVQKYVIDYCNAHKVCPFPFAFPFVGGVYL